MENNARMSQEELDRLFAEWEGGDREVLAELVPLVFDELHTLAARHMHREGPGHTFQTSALVNEAYLRLTEQKKVRWENRAHFLAIATRLMRRILVDHARAKRRDKRGGDRRPVELDEALVVGAEPVTDLVALDEALEALEARVVELRFIAGLDLEETAQVLGVSPNTVTRDWNLARAWLYRALRPGETNGG